jgi:FAD-dependent urate hydroxylase
MALEDAIVLAESLTSADSIAVALTAFERRRRPRTDWVRAQTRRRDRARNLPPTIRSLMLSGFGERILSSNYQPYAKSPDPREVHKWRLSGEVSATAIHRVRLTVKA